MKHTSFEQTRWSLQDLLPAASGPEFEALLAELEKAVSQLEDAREQLSPDISEADFAGLMEQVEKLCEEICLINKGKVVLSGSLADVKSRYGHGGVSLRYSGDGAFLADLPGVELAVVVDSDGPLRAPTTAPPRMGFGCWPGSWRRRAGGGAGER